jgi:glycosyltransferase involved in cell wall biosynthesis
MIRSELNLYGVSKIIVNLAVDLKEKGHTVIFASDNRDSFKREIEEKGFHHYYVPFNIRKKNLIDFMVSFLLLFKIVRKEKIDIIHSHHRWCSLISYAISKCFKIPLVTTYHGIHHGKKSLSVWGDRIIAVSEDGKKHLNKYFEQKISKIIIINNGIKVPVSDYLNYSKNSCKKKNHYIIGCIARLSPEKNHKILLKAMKIILKRHSNTKLFLIGDGELANEISELSVSLKIDNNIEFLGEIQKIESLLLEIDLVVLPSLTEGMPLSILEALSFGKPVVATSVGDIPKIIINNETGLLVPSNSSKLLANAIEYMIDNRNAAFRMGRKGRDLVKSKFSLDKMTEDIEKVYIEILADRKKSRMQ